MKKIQNRVNFGPTYKRKKNWVIHFGNLQIYPYTFRHKKETQIFGK